MSPALRNGLLLAAALAALAAGYFAAQWVRRAQIDETSATLVDFALPDLEGRTRWLSEWRGKTIVLNFWATWCAPCREEVPLFVRLQQELGSRGLQIVGVAIEPREPVVPFIQSFNVNYPILLGPEAGLGLLTRYGNREGALPYSVVIAPDGSIVARKLGAFRGEELDRLITPYLVAKMRNPH